MSAVAGAAAPGTVITVSQSPPFGLRKLSATLARALGLPEATPARRRRRTRRAAGRARDRRARSPQGGAPPVLVVASDHLVSYEERVCDTLSAGGAAAFVVGASGGFARLGASARAGREVYDVWRLGTEPEARYRLEVLFDAYAASATEALAAPGAGHRAPRGRVRRGLRQPAPPPDPARARPAGGQRRAAGGHELRRRDRQPGGGLGRHRPGARPGRRRARRPPGGARLRRRGGDRPGDRGHRPRARRSARPPRSRARRSICPRTTVGPAAVRPNPTREA